MVSSNSVFFQVVTAPSLEGVGWEVRVLDHRDFTTVVAVIAEYVELTVGPELSQPGAGSITLDADSPFWATSLPNSQPATTIKDYEHLWEVYENGQLRFQFLGTNVEEKLVGEDETRSITISGPGAAAVLKWACVLRPNFPGPVKPNQPTTVTGLFWEFPYTWSAMRMWLTLLRASQTRGTVPWVTPLFSETADSGGAKWEVIKTPESEGATPGEGYRPEKGINLLDLLDVHTGQDLTKQFAMRAEWFMWPGFRLDVRKTIGSIRTSEVIFFEGALEQKERTRIRDEVYNYVVTEDQNYATSLAADSASIAKWNKREQLQNHNGNVVDPTQRNALSAVFLAQSKDEKSQWVIKVPYDQPGRHVFIDYGIGDWVGIASLNSVGLSEVEPYRVLSIVVQISDSIPVVELTLQSRLEQKQRELQKQITSITNAAGDGTLRSRPDVKIPNLPTVPGPLEMGPDGVVRLGSYGVPGGGPSAGFGGGFGGFGGGIQVFIQSNDPGSEASPGDFWYQPGGFGEGPWGGAEPALETVYEAPVDELDSDGGTRRSAMRYRGD